METGKLARTVFSLVAFLFLAPSPSPGGNKPLLSLRIAEARKERSRTMYYKSVIRQQKNRRPTAAPHPPSAR